MQHLQAYTYELMPTGERQRRMRRFVGSCRFVFIRALVLQQALRALELAYCDFFEKRAFQEESSVRRLLPDTGPIRVDGQRNQCPSGRTGRAGLWRKGAVRPSCEAGTRRSESWGRDMHRLSAVDLSGLQSREDVK